MPQYRGPKQGQQGKADAIALSINQDLWSQGMTISCRLQRNTFVAIVSGETVPNRAMLVGLIRQKVLELGDPGIARIAIEGRMAGSERALWKENFALGARALKQAKTQQKQQRLKSQKQWLLRGAMVLLVALVVLAGTFVWVHQVQRQRLPVAQTLAQEAGALENASNMKELKAHRDQLRQAAKAVRTPSVLGYVRRENRTELKQIHARLRQANRAFKRQRTALKNFEFSLNLAKQAGEIVQGPPHRVAVWERALGKWQRAVRLLESIPDDAFVFDQAQAKLAVYGQNRDAIAQRVVREKQALQQYGQARKLADELVLLTLEAPYARQEMEAMVKKLERVVSLLKSVPGGTQMSAMSERRLRSHTQDLQQFRQVLQGLQVCELPVYWVYPRHLGDSGYRFTDCYFNGLLMISTFEDSQHGYAVPIRKSQSGSCVCPYDIDAAGRYCGSRSEYSNAEKSEGPVCFKPEPPPK